jgi:hypothetical protein
MHVLRFWRHEELMKVLLLLLGLAQLRGCASALCEVSGFPDERAREVPLGTSLPRVTAVAEERADDWIVADNAALTELIAGAERHLAQFSEPVYHWSDDGFAARSNGTWRYSRATFETKGHAEITFTETSGVLQVTVAIGSVPLRWIPLSGGEVSGLLFSTRTRGGESGNVRVDRVTPAGSEPIVEFDAGYRDISHFTTSAEQLPDGRIAVVSSSAEGVLKLRLISGHSLVESPLPNPNLGEMTIVATAMSPKGLLGVAARGSHGELTAALVNVDDVPSARFRVVLGADDHARALSMVSVGDRFLIAWVGASDRSLRTRELTFDGFLLPPVEIEDDEDASNPFLTLLDAGDAITVVSRSRVHGLVARHVGIPLAGRELAASIWQLVCPVSSSR